MPGGNGTDIAIRVQRLERLLSSEGLTAEWLDATLDPLAVPTDVSNGQVIDAEYINTIKRSVNTWQGAVNAGGFGLTNTGSVGIGVAAAQAPLHVLAGADQGLLVRAGLADTTATRIESINAAASLNAPMEFRATKFNFTTGNVGIGVVTPIAALHVALAIPSAAVVRMHQVGNAGGSGNVLEIADDRGFSGNMSGSTLYVASRHDTGSSTGNIFSFNIGYPGAEQSVLVGKMSGLVGIGKAAPAYKLDVVGDINITGNYRKNGAIVMLLSETAARQRFNDGAAARDAGIEPGELYVNADGHVMLLPKED